MGKKPIDKKIMLIVNPCAGMKHRKTDIAEIADLFYKNGFEPAIYFTSPECKAGELLKAHAKDFDIVACCGGDGTFSETVEGAMEIENCPPLGYIPSGTTNDLARSLALPKNMKRAAHAIVNEEPQPLDIGSFNGSHFAYIASFGAFTEVSYNTPQKAKNIFGRLAYIFQAMKCLHKISSYHVKVETDDVIIEDDFIFGSVTNSTSVAGIFKFDKDLVDFDDGMYEVLLVRRPKYLSTAIKIILSMLNTTYKNEYITLFQASQVKFSSETPLDWSLDGEHKAGEQEISIKNNHSAVYLIRKQ